MNKKRLPKAASNLYYYKLLQSKHHRNRKFNTYRFFRAAYLVSTSAWY